MLGKKKRGMSEIIMTLLIVLLVIGTVAAVIVWNKSIFSKLTSDNKSCSEISFTLGDFCYEEQDNILNTETGQLEKKIHLIFNARNELENPIIEGFSITLGDKYGNTQIISSLFDTQVEGFETKKIVSDFFTNFEDIEHIKIIPLIKIKEETINCEDKPTLINWRTIKQC